MDSHTSNSKDSSAGQIAGENGLDDIASAGILCAALVNLVQTLSKAVFITDEHGTVIFLNRTAEKLAATTLASARRMRIGDLLYTPVDLELRRYSELLRVAVRKGRSTTRSIVSVTTGDGENQLIDYEAIPLVDDAFRLIGGILIASNCSHLTAVEIADK